VTELARCQWTLGDASPALADTAATKMLAA
jgi:hypothetical protein